MRSMGFGTFWQQSQGRGSDRKEIKGWKRWESERDSCPCGDAAKKSSMPVLRDRQREEAGSVRERLRREGRRGESRESCPSRSAATSRGGAGRQTEEW